MFIHQENLLLPSVCVLYGGIFGVCFGFICWFGVIFLLWPRGSTSCLGLNATLSVWPAWISATVVGCGGRTRVSEYPWAGAWTSNFSSRHRHRRVERMCEWLPRLLSRWLTSGPSPSSAHHARPRRPVPDLHCSRARTANVTWWNGRHLTFTDHYPLFRQQNTNPPMCLSGVCVGAAVIVFSWRNRKPFRSCQHREMHSISGRQ